MHNFPKKIILSAVLLLLTSCASNENTAWETAISAANKETELQNITSVISEKADTEQNSVTAAEKADVHSSTYETAEISKEIFSDTEPFEMLFPVYINGYFEYMDKCGNIVSDCKYTAARFVSEGLYAVCIDDKWGFIDRNESEVIPCQYENVSAFSDGLAAVKIDETWGYINMQGTMVINNEFDEASDFSEGYACVIRESPYYEYIDKNGNTVFGTGMWSGAKFSEERAVFSSYSGSSVHYGIFDTEGKLLLEDFYPYNKGAYISSYKNGLAVFSVIEDEKIKYIYIDKSGNNCFDDCFDDAYPFNEELAVAEKGGKRGVIDKTGEFVFYNDGVTGAYSEGYIKFFTQTEKYGFLDKNGNIAIPAKYNKIYKDFRDGLALAELDGTLIYIDAAGNEVFSFEKPEYMRWVS